MTCGQGADSSLTNVSVKPVLMGFCSVNQKLGDISTRRTRTIRVSLNCDKSQYLWTRTDKEASARDCNIILNWTRELSDKLPKQKNDCPCVWFRLPTGCADGIIV
ncbi:hypothetical protein PoB_001846900 [Plakobranchus ocellatus]|uniref:Uncharacterized protein n=1 Tax=Plakobranchus ocellatus TaxID=259542 RepID=A0AAV3Z9G9_9GAST|nr:hypothetical protein PoB_001846900 [Plakobranchus ocellatus]